MGVRNGLQSLPELNSDVGRLVEDFSRETDRGVALLAAAFLDDVLDVMLRCAFVDDAVAVNKLLGAGRPLESFGSRAHTAYCIGLLGADLYADINLVREVRNDFAHRQPKSFDLPEISAKCQKLRCVTAFHAGQDCTPRELFIATVVLIANHLMIRTAMLHHAAPAKSFTEAGVLRLR